MHRFYEDLESSLYKLLNGILMGAMEMCIRGDHELLWLALQVEKTMKEIIDDLGLEISGVIKLATKVREEADNSDNMVIKVVLDH
ncbi:MAG: hypothetical protein ACM3X1_07295 [Ignavibacteriales bacterium]